MPECGAPGGRMWRRMAAMPASAGLTGKCQTARLKTLPGPSAGYFQHALASDFGPAADANTTTPANHAVPIPASCTRYSPTPIALTAPDTPKATPRSGSPASSCPLRYAPLRFRQPLVQPQERFTTAVAHLKIHALPAIRQLNHRRPNLHFLSLLTAPRPMISPHLVKGNRRRYAPPLALHRHPGPNAQGPPDFF